LIFSFFRWILRLLHVAFTPVDGSVYGNSTLRHHLLLAQRHQTLSDKLDFPRPKVPVQECSHPSLWQFEQRSDCQFTEYLATNSIESEADIIVLERLGNGLHSEQATMAEKRLA
jgi:hypothetical protein